jgi:hypothetical protein
MAFISHCGCGWQKRGITYEGLDCAGIEVERDGAERFRDGVEVAARRSPPQSNPLKHMKD